MSLRQRKGAKEEPAAAPKEHKPKQRSIGDCRADGGAKYPRTSPYLFETDFFEFIYKPHTISVALALFSVVGVLFAYTHIEGRDPAASIKLGLAAAACAFITFGSVHLPDGLLIRPHPAAWRALLAVAVMYMCMMVFFLFQDIPTVRAILGFYDANLRRNLPETSYAEDCRLSTPEDPYKFWNTIFDEFLLAHALGYWGKMMVVRDWRIVTAISLTFEVVEVSLQHILPNFKECWWDHVIADILLCNAGGTLLGYLTLRLISAKQYHWAKVSDIPSIKGKAARIVSQFYPRQVDPYEWHVFASPKRLVQVLMLLFIIALQETNCFTMKNILHIPSSHHLIVVRLCIWGFFAIPSLREYYEFCTEPECKRLGTSAWTGIAMVVFETSWIAKMIVEGGYFREPLPAYIGLPLGAALACFLLWAVLYYGVAFMRKTLVTRIFMNLLFYSTFIIILGMCFMANVDIQWKQAEFLEVVRRYDLW